MALIEQNYNLDLVPSGKPMVVNVSQYDKDSRRLVFNLFNGGVAYAPETGTAAYIMGSKPDQTGFIYGMTVEGTKASVDIYQQMTAVAGNIPCEIRLADPSGAVIGSANFTLAVEKAALDEDAVISETDIPVFENLAAQAAASAAEAAEGIRDRLRCRLGNDRCTAGRRNDGPGADQTVSSGRRRRLDQSGSGKHGD